MTKPKCMWLCSLLVVLASCRASRLQLSSPHGTGTEREHRAPQASPAPVSVTTERLDLASVQRRLAWAGFYLESSESEAAAQLEQAVKRFQRFAKLPEHGVIDAETWALMQRLYDPGQSRPSGTALPPLPWPASFIRMTQMILADLGYELDGTSGVLDTVTQQALQRFQEAHQISGDGALTAETLLVLVEQRCRNGCDLRVSVAATAEASALPGTPPFTDQAAPINTALSGPDLPILMSHLLQEVLTQQGYAIPEAQERLGPPLQAALRRFQSDHGLAAHGQLTQETILVLLATACGAGCEFRLTVGARQEDKSAGPVSIDGPQIRKIIPGQTLPQGPVQVADKAYAIEYVECSAVSGAWVRLYEGTVVRQDDRTVALRLEERFSYRYHPDSEGVDRTDWWCIPPKRHCYVPIDFHDWNGTFAKRAIASFPADRVVHARLGIIHSVLPFVHKQCNQ